MRRVILRSLVLLLASLAIVGAAARVGSADPVGPQREDSRIMLAIQKLLRKEHLTRHPLDNEMSERWLKTYLKNLDPMKIYFTQADVDEFSAQKERLDDMAVRGDVSFGYEVFRRYLQRVDERLRTVDELLKIKPDFTVDEEIVTDPEQLHFARSEDEAREFWRKRVKFDLLSLKAEEADKKAEKEKAAKEKAEKEKRGEPVTDVDKPAPADANISPQEKISKRYHSLAKRRHQTDNDELLEMYLTSLTTSYDPHTTYMSQSSLDNFEIVMGLHLEGIGAALQFTDGYTVVGKVIPGGPAAKDNRLHPEDKIVGVGQGPDGEMEDVVDMKLNDVVKRIRGPRGTKVRLKVIPAGLTDTREYLITRDKISLSESEARSEVIPSGRKADGAPFRVGIINLPSFYMDMSGARDGVQDFKSTTRDVAKLLDQFNREQVDVCVLDLRKNGGGSLTEAINLTGLFIDTGPVVQVKDADARVQHYDDLERGMIWSKPLVVIVDKFSASASEIFAGAIQDYHRGLIVGDDSTHGKGTVQQLLDLGRQLFNSPQSGALKITMQQFYLPDGDSTQNRGVLSDVVLPSLSSQYDVGEKSLDYALKFDKVPAAPYRKMDLLTPPMIKTLNELSLERRKSAPEWNRVNTEIEEYNAQKKRKRVSLNETKFLADRSKLNSEREEEKELDEMNDPNRPIYKRDYYGNEVLNITVDYLRLLPGFAAAAVGRVR